MDSFFFRVDHELLRSPAFQELGGSAIKVYLVLGLYADFTTGWAYPSIRTIAKQAGLSRQTVLAATTELTKRGLIATSKSTGKSTAYKIIRQTPPSERPKRSKKIGTDKPDLPEIFRGYSESVQESLEVGGGSGPISSVDVAQFFGISGQITVSSGQEAGPKPETLIKTDDNRAISIPGTPFTITVDGRLHVVARVQDLLAEQGLPARIAERLASKTRPEDVAKVVLNALYLKGSGKLQNAPGYIRVGLEEGYELLPQVATKLESRRKELEAELVLKQREREQQKALDTQQSEEAALEMVLQSLSSQELQSLLVRAIASLPEPIVRRNPTLSNPFVRNRVYELAGGEPLD